LACNGSTCRRPVAILAAFGLVWMALLPVTAAASLYHVRNGGTRSSGPSVPSDWTPPNCYPDIASGAAAASAPDSVLLFDEDHVLSTAVQVPAFLGNPRLDGDHSACRIVLGANGQLVVDPASLVFEARGVTVTESASSSDYAAFLVSDPGSSLVSVSFTDCLFFGNRGSDRIYPGGSCLTALPDSGTILVRFKRCQLDSNVTEGPGGALYLDDGYALLLDETTFQGDVSKPGWWSPFGTGGAVAVRAPLAPTSVTLVDSGISACKAWGPGAGLFLVDCDVTLLRSAISDNRSAVGGVTWASGAGVHAELSANLAGSFIADDCVFRNNTQDLSGGDLAADGGAILVKGISGRVVNVSISDCLFESNFAAQGAGLYVGRYAQGTVRRCSFRYNRSQLQGGASYKGGGPPDTEGETAVYEYCEFIGNEAGLTEQGAISASLGRGGAFATRTHPRAEFYNCTFVDNVAHGPAHLGDAFYQSDGDGPLDADTRRCELHNCVFYGTGGNDVQVRSADSGFSIVESCAWESGEFQCNGVVPVQTVILTGSPFESLTHPRPYIGSPIIDAAVDFGFTVDIEWNPVPDGLLPDIGSYERQRVVSAPVAGATDDAVLESWPNPFAATMTVSFELPRAGFVELDVFDVAGRRVAALDRGVREAGRRQIRWTGRDDAGRDLASGVYWVRLRAGAQEAVRKVVLSR